MRTFMTNLADFLISNGLLPQAQGLTDAAIAMVTAHVPCPIPTAYHAFLQTFGGSDTSRWCGGDDLGIAGVEAAHRVRRHMIHDGPMDWLGDPLVIPIMQYAGYTLSYLRADMGDDPPVLSIVLGDAPPPTVPTVVAAAFSESTKKSGAWEFAHSSALLQASSGNRDDEKQHTVAQMCQRLLIAKPARYGPLPPTFSRSPINHNL